MAFKINCTTPHGFEAQGAYCRVEGLTLMKGALTFALRRYKDNTGLPCFLEQYFSAPYVLTSVNPLQQAYDYLKTLPEFATAVDVFEDSQPQQ
ncbi:hypothetical protein L0Z36_10095 [Burkholderia multivorans]|uniref:hypothetical protein n=1 Tax=Burkholderia multivorans TaxID=87883 RepID=UPI002019B651|nr:hypothetical protein [Burkholderia multivorans]UQP02226.1 hypothetical protein L0Z36_10095 [Burkholderia multivorans]